jgi:hypothetical protein
MGCAGGTLEATDPAILCGFNVVCIIVLSKGLSLLCKKIQFKPSGQSGSRTQLLYL